MAALFLISFALGVVLAIPLWIVRQRSASRRGLRLARQFDRREAVPCALEPVALNACLLPQDEFAGEVSR